MEKAPFPSMICIEITREAGCIGWMFRRENSAGLGWPEGIYSPFVTCELMWTVMITEDWDYNITSWLLICIQMDLQYLQKIFF